MYSKEALKEVVREKALEFGDFTLASGKKASFYLDCRKVTLDSHGTRLVAQGILELIGDELPDAVGGMAIGADPIRPRFLQRPTIRENHCGVLSSAKRPKSMVREIR